MSRSEYSRGMVTGTGDNMRTGAWVIISQMPSSYWSLQTTIIGSGASEKDLAERSSHEKTALPLVLSNIIREKD